MSTRTRQIEAFVSPKSRCAVCGDPDWRAMWAGHVVLCVCRRCAIEVLPRLIADAVWQSNMRPADADHSWQQARAEFWRAIAICQDRERHAAEDHAQVTRLLEHVVRETVQ